MPVNNISKVYLVWNDSCCFSKLLWWFQSYKAPAEAVWGLALLRGSGAENEGIKLVPMHTTFLSSLDKIQ